MLKSALRSGAKGDAPSGDMAYLTSKPNVAATKLLMRTSQQISAVQVVSWVRGKKWRKFASRVFTREELLPEEMTEHLTSEQRAAVDCMTLVDAVRFAALAGSSMSHLVHELRILRGHPQDSSAILGDTNVGLYKWTYSVKSEGGQRDED